MPDEDDGWGWMMYACEEMEAANDMMGFGISCMKRAARVLKEEKEMKELE